MPLQQARELNAAAAAQRSRSFPTILGSSRNSNHQDEASLDLKQELKTCAGFQKGVCISPMARPLASPSPTRLYQNTAPNMISRGLATPGQLCRTGAKGRSMSTVKGIGPPAAHDSKRRAWNFSTHTTKPGGAKAAELKPDERFFRVVWDNVHVAREKETNRRAASNKKHLAENRLRSSMRGGAQSRATKAFCMHPRVWSLLEPPAEQETYYRYPKIEHDSRNEVADLVEPGMYRAMLRMNPRVQKYMDRFQIPDRLMPAILEIQRLIEYLRNAGEFDESLRHRLCGAIQESFEGTLLYEGKNVMASIPRDDENLQARLDTIDEMKRELMSILDSLATESSGDGACPAEMPSREFLRDVAVQQVHCFLASALLERSKPFSTSGFKQAP
mmetsp:Transcript_90186/g.160632  ORF Transcript_90186/g.160632 Transcript_90186/m.160632 type:complete len:388 (-) Transcript_90186:122-1285(-)|eukprot:CAMPEP_0197660544 /NCGR_PEP_ID=MMETSP1338-20131121/50909_1 /TAXON_ID=43686 ORGANISM="Pelagodinium beii, Strain RCC1491" /NCGR_SAMPLE_ID=MMETSP1338 /ASSEMBLY_ACC=CAM_ASM_000754 /LENGTH=387 /DNA_ID=CAMNT_0043237913 /DNA_START=108 /DNA_END=1271 /DNA_ORIENTATION=-